MSITEKEQRFRFQLVNGLRPVFTGLAAGFAFFNEATSVGWVLVGFIVLSFVWLVVAGRLSVEQESGRVSFFPTSLDVCFMTIFIFFSGGVFSPGIFVYTYVVAICAMNTRARQGLFAAIFIQLVFSGVGIAVQLGWLPNQNVIGDVIEPNWGQVGFVLATVALINFAVQTLVQKLVRSLEAKNNSLEKQSEELATANESLQKAQRQIKEELKVARAIQEHLLPKNLPANDRFSVQARNISLTEVSGDYLDCFTDRDGNLGLLIADSAGHGVPAALVASMTKMAADQSRDLLAEPGRFLSAINQALLNRTNLHFVAVTYLYYIPGTRCCRYAMAGNPAPILLRRGQPALELPGQGGVLGIRADAAFASQEIMLQPEDRILMFTDGINECRNDQGVQLESEQLSALLTGQSLALDGNQLTDRIIEDIRAFTGERGFEDDVTMMLLEAK